MYEDNRAGGGYYDIYAYNFKTNTEKIVCSAADSQYGPDISGTKVVWYHWRNGMNTDIYMKELAGGAEVPVAIGAGGQSRPAINGNQVVYVDGGDIVLKDMSSGSVTKLTDNAFTQTAPDIDGTTVVWQSENVAGNEDVFRVLNTDGQCDQPDARVARREGSAVGLRHEGRLHQLRTRQPGHIHRRPIPWLGALSPD